MVISLPPARLAPTKSFVRVRHSCRARVPKAMAPGAFCPPPKAARSPLPTASITYASPQAEICEHVLSCNATQASFDLVVTNGNNQGSYGLKVLDEQDQTVLFSGALPYGEPLTRTFAYTPSKQYRLVLTDASGEALCLQNPYPLSFSEPTVTLAVDASEKTVCGGSSASFSAEASMNAQGCGAPQGKSFTYKLYAKQGGQLLKAWAATEGPVQTGPLPIGSYLLRAWPAEEAFASCSGETELLVLPSSLKAEVKTQNPSCHGSGDGSAQTLITDGEKYLEGTAYRCAWFRAEDAQKTDTLSALSSVSGLEAGNYVLEVRDAGACAEPPLQVYFSLTDAFPLGQVTLQTQSCGDPATLSPAGGEAPYTFTFEEKTENGYKLLLKTQGSVNGNAVTA